MIFLERLCDCCWWWIRGGTTIIGVIYYEVQGRHFASSSHVEVATLVNFNMETQGLGSYDFDGSHPGPLRDDLEEVLKTKRRSDSDTIFASKSAWGVVVGFDGKFPNERFLITQGVTSEDRVFWDPVTAPFT